MRLLRICAIVVDTCSLCDMLTSSDGAASAAEDTTMNSATNPSIPSIHTISEASIAAPATHAAFIAGFETARAGKRSVAPKSYSNAEKFAFKHGHFYAKSFRSYSAQQALESFLVTESMWVGSATYSVERDLEAGNYRAGHA